MMIRLTISLAIVICCAILIHCADDLDDQLRHYEILDISQLHVKRSKRSINNVKRDAVEYNFRALKRRFHIHLQRRTFMPTLLHGFDVVTIDGFGNEEKVVPDLSDFYEGSLVDEKKSWVQASFDGNKVSLWIESRNETYVVEPARPHVSNATDDQVIIYKGSELKLPKKKNFCNFVRANESYGGPVLEHGVDAGSTSDNLNINGSKSRRRRSASGPLDTCSLLLIADFRFFSKIGQKSVATTSRILIELIDRVNRVYRPTKFTDSRRRIRQGYGFGIKRIQIHKGWYKGPINNHYNREPKSTEDTWVDRELLSAFDRADYSDYCLSHLFTYQKFGGGTLGLAYIASDREGALGGVCSPKQNCMGKYCSINTGWTTFQDSSGNTLVTLESHLVTSHELGHNMGSSHDPDTPECSPSPEHNGKYLMYQYSVSGYEPNNHLFSPCSRRAIGRVLEKKADRCFERREKSFCGNNRQEGDEECDAGSNGLLGTDPCCTVDCRLRRGMKCSPANHDCCTSDCVVAPARKLCAYSDETSPCEGEAYCDGVSFTCPLPAPRDNATCGVEGICRNRTCIPYCERIGRIPCQCDKIKDSCYMCCRRTLKDHCEPLTPRKVLKDGLPCVQGVCKKGQCSKRISITIERFWHAIKYDNVNAIWKIMWKNIVGTIITLSLILWIPLSCFISYYDRLSEQGKIQH